MDSLQFALIIIVVAVLFLAFALAVIALILGNHTTQANIVKLLSSLSKRLSGFLGK